MRIKYSKLIAFIIVFVNIVLVFYALRLFNHYHKFVSGPTIIFQNVKPEALINYKYSQKNIGKLITVIIREFETHENDVSATVDSILKILPNAEIYILFDKVFIVKSGLFHEGRTPLRTHYAKWKFKQIVQDRFKRLYDLFKIKLVAREGRTEWYGCNRETPRCFEEVLDSMPSYLYENKWTPPCCLAHLQKTAKYILEVLDHAGIRYWLESGSLLGAVRSADVLPWDHKVDIGFINDDTNRCRWLQIAQNRSVIDNRGFFWEKILAGNLFRIYFSKYNKIFVNLIPFFHKNGTMSRDIFYDSYRNMEFSDNFLHPMSSIEFIGKNVPCPNNVRSFLELKFGKGCIEHPEYPNPIKMKFPEN
ncbi:hypothetical protein WA026_011340 [Henosepilachna vigintioctopunctata]|uniref:Fukutin n=1 Tax=Henosepilachna vigintioctopunctata TaxID=420089 RepID=A0AAW1UA71_9CUCU